MKKKSKIDMIGPAATDVSEIFEMLDLTDRVKALIGYKSVSGSRSGRKSKSVSGSRSGPKTASLSRHGSGRYS
ncbi:MAG: hypothetical protein HZB29_05035 [Nitrospinae bacterium]|nr:hypothetical protein [Nitrospinota bacterium]